VTDIDNAGMEGRAIVETNNCKRTGQRATPANLRAAKRAARLARAGSLPTLRSVMIGTRASRPQVETTKGEMRELFGEPFEGGERVDDTKATRGRS
jgi:hypothetical protein